RVFRSVLFIASRYLFEHFRLHLCEALEEIPVQAPSISPCSFERENKSEQADDSRQPKSYEQKNITRRCQKHIRRSIGGSTRRKKREKCDPNGDRRSAGSSRQVRETSAACH